MKAWVTKLSLGTDKRDHLLLGVLVAIGAYLLVGSGIAFVAVALLILCGVAIGKEVFDSTGYGTPDIWDAVFTVIGGVVMIIILWYVQKRIPKKVTTA
jgi:hypothetical protein